MLKSLSRLTINQLILSNVHIGAYNSLLNIKVKAYLLGVKQERHIINILYTQVQLKLLIYYIINVISFRQKILVVKDLDFHNFSAVFSCKNIFFFNRKWVGGLLTNFRVVRKSLKVQNGNSNFFDITSMKYLPSLVFLFNTTLSKWALFEAGNLEIPSSAIFNSDSVFYNFINYPIMGNNKSFEALYFYANVVKTAVLKGQQKERLKILKVI